MSLCVCIYILVQQNTILAIDFFIIRALASLPFPSPMWLIYSWHFCMLDLRCLQAVCAVEAELQRVQAQHCSKQDATAFYLLCCRWIYLPEHRGWGFCFFNNKNTKYSLLVLEKARTLNMLFKLARTISQQCFYQMMRSDTPGEFLPLLESITLPISSIEEDFFWMPFLSRV